VTACAVSRISRALARALQPRKPITVSQWADAERFLSSKGSAEPGRWRTHRNPPLREPMDCLSARSAVQDVVCRFPIQFGKTEIAVNTLGYTMDHHPGPVMVCLPSENSMNKWVEQKLTPMLDETPAARRALSSVSSRESANRRNFKDFNGGQLYIEHAGAPGRLKLTTVRTLIVDELDDFPLKLSTGDDPVDMLDGRTSAFPATYKRLKISTPGLLGVSRIDQEFQTSDQRRYHVPCPDCGHEQPLEWSGLHWNPEATDCWYACRDCGVVIREHQKTAMIAAGRWVAANPGARVRGYTINCLYYPIGLGPRWIELVAMWRAAQNDPAKLKTFTNDRLAEPWEDAAMRAVKHNVIRDRAEAYPLRVAPYGVLAITAGVDTQDNRLAVQLTGWGRGLASWTLDYIELPGDPAADEVWVSLTDLLNRPIQHAGGQLMRVEATAIDAGGHRTEDVKAYVRRKLVRRGMVIFGAVPNNAPVLSKGKAQDVNWRGQLDKRGVLIYHVGTVATKHLLYARLSTDAEKQPQARLVHFTDELPAEYFTGLVSETYNPARNRFEKKRGGVRNEPLDTWVYSYAATHHPELRLHRLRGADWDAREARLGGPPPPASIDPGAPEGEDEAGPGDQAPPPAAPHVARGTPPPAPAPAAPRPVANPFAKPGWGFGQK
jgi:phage terminase large subunit GpA-like protein